MKSLTKFMLIAGVTLALTGCASLAKLQMQNVTLNNGTKAKVGQVQPASNWGCVAVGWQEANWEKVKIESLGMGYNSLKNKALAYANKRNLKANYIYIKIPNETDVAGINVTMARKAITTFYKCKLINPENKLGYTEKSSIG